LKNKTFTTLHDFSTKVFTDDFCYDNFETYKVKGTSSKNSTLDYKGKVKLENKEGNYSASLTDESSGKFSFHQNKFWLWFGTRRNGDYKVHLDFGDVKIKDTKLNLFSNVKTTIKFDKFNLRFGANYFGNKCESSTRLEHCTES